MFYKISDTIEEGQFPSQAASEHTEAVEHQNEGGGSADGSIEGTKNGAEADQQQNNNTSILMTPGMTQSKKLKRRVTFSDFRTIISIYGLEQMVPIERNNDAEEGGGSEPALRLNGKVGDAVFFLHSSR